MCDRCQEKKETRVFALPGTETTPMRRIQLCKECMGFMNGFIAVMNPAIKTGWFWIEADPRL